MLNDPPTWLGGYSLNVCRNCPTMATLGTIVHSLSPHHRAYIIDGCKSPHKHLGAKQLPADWSLDEVVYPLPQATPLSVRHPLGRFGSRPVDRLACDPASVGNPMQRNVPNPR